MNSAILVFFEKHGFSRFPMSKSMVLLHKTKDFHVFRDVPKTKESITFSLILASPPMKSIEKWKNSKITKVEKTTPLSHETIVFDDSAKCEKSINPTLLKV